jgi:hypothetical protein
MSETVATYTIVYNRTSNHIKGIDERLTTSEFNYSVSACSALSRSGARFATGKSFTDLATALDAARLNAKVGGRHMCKKCETAALEVLNGTR